MTIVLDGSNGITAPGGTAAAPSLTTSGDVNTGIFFPAADTIAFSEGGVEAMRIDSSGNLAFSSTAQRITGDMTNATLTNRLAFQTSTANGNTTVLVLPNGTSTISQFLAFNTADPTNSSNAGLVATSTVVRLSSGQSGTGSYLPLTFFTSGSEQARLDITGNLGLGVTPSPWSGFRALQIGGTTSLWSSTSGNSSSFYTNNGYFNGSNRIYLTNGFASEYIQGSGQHIWYTAASGTAGNAITFTQAMTLDASGNLGIGTTSPTAGFRLDVQATTARQRIESTTGTNEVQQRLTNSGGTFFLSLDNSTGTGFGAAYSAVLWHSGNYPMLFATNNTERMRLDTSGNLGIGTTSPSSYGAIVIVRSQNSDARVWVRNDDAGSSSRASYVVNASGNSWSMGMGSTANNSNSLTWVTDVGGGNNEKMRIDTSGTLMVNTTDQDAGIGGTPSTNQFSFRPADGMRCSVTGANYFNRSNDGAIFTFRRNGTAVGSISVSAGATAYNTSSDYRLKNTIAPITGALAKVALLKPCTYKWNADGSDGQGFIAHELAEVVPDCVTGEKDAVDVEGNPRYQGVDTSFLVATLTAAIQELTARVAALEGNN